MLHEDEANCCPFCVPVLQPWKPAHDSLPGPPPCQIRKPTKPQEGYGRTPDLSLILIRRTRNYSNQKPIKKKKVQIPSATVKLTRALGGKGARLCTHTGSPLSVGTWTGFHHGWPTASRTRAVQPCFWQNAVALGTGRRTSRGDVDTAVLTLALEVVALVSVDLYPAHSACQVRSGLDLQM